MWEDRQFLHKLELLVEERRSSSVSDYFTIAKSLSTVHVGSVKTTSYGIEAPAHQLSMHLNQDLHQTELHLHGQFYFLLDLLFFDLQLQWLINRQWVVL